MRSISSTNRLIFPAGYADSPPLPKEEVWDVLERYAREIVHCDRSADQKRLALKAVYDSIGAEAVYWYPGPSGEPVEIVGELALPADWCAAFARKSIEEVPGLDGQLLRSQVPATAATAPFHPHSAALVRVSKSQSSWIVALSFSTRRSFQVTDMRIMSLIRQILVNQRRHLDRQQRMSESLSWLAQCLITSIDAHVPHAKGHSERVAKIAVQIGKRMSLPTSVLSDLYFAGLLHNLGITAVPQSLLLKAGKLTDEEYAQVKAQPVIGDEILAGIKHFAHLRPAVRHHHERYDGQGYPDGLWGDAIPLMARVLAVADSFDAMMSPRPHRPALPKGRIDAILAEGAGQQWDPCIVKHCRTCRRQLDALCEAPPPAETAPAVPFTVDAWDAESLRTVSVCKKYVRPMQPYDALLEVASHDSP